jgi:alpha,alpha-trehalase
MSWHGRPTSSIGWSAGKERGSSLASHEAIDGAFYDIPSVVVGDVGRITHGRHVLLLTDYDGTLAALAPTPAEATISAELQNDIAEIEALPSVTFGIVSGRRLSDVRARVGHAAEYAAGLHGLEIEGPQSRFHHHALDPIVPVIGTLVQTAKDALAWCPGIYFEDKMYALTCQVRLAPLDCAERALREFQTLAEPQLDAHVLKTMNGAKALEVLPATDWHKGRAVEWIRARVEARVDEPVSVVYLGDDRTDEDAFRSLGEEDVAIGVGERPNDALIDWRLEGPASVDRFLDEFCRLRRRE